MKLTSKQVMEKYNFKRWFIAKLVSDHDLARVRGKGAAYLYEAKDIERSIKRYEATVGIKINNPFDDNAMSMQHVNVYLGKGDTFIRRLNIPREKRQVNGRLVWTYKKADVDAAMKRWKKKDKKSSPATINRKIPYKMQNWASNGPRKYCPPLAVEAERTSGGSGFGSGDAGSFMAHLGNVNTAAHCNTRAGQEKAARDERRKLAMERTK